jgi:hypothetical protein
MVSAKHQQKIAKIAECNGAARWRKTRGARPACGDGAQTRVTKGISGIFVCQNGISKKANSGA